MDVALTLEVPDDRLTVRDFDLKVIVVNHGSRTAYDVEVELDLVFPEVDETEPEKASHFVERQDDYLMSLENNGRTFRWTIPALEGLGHEEINVEVVHRPGGGSGIGNAAYPHEFVGTVTTSSFESDLHRGNNTARVWEYLYFQGGAVYRSIQVMGNYWVTATVDNPSPSPGDTVNFTITADRRNPIPRLIGESAYTPPPIDLKVDIDLTSGLSVSGTPTYTSLRVGTGNDGSERTVEETKPDSVSYSNGVFNIGTLKSKEPTRNSVTLPVTVASNAVVSEQCLTATLTGNPPPGPGPHDDRVSDNVAKFCLGLTPDGEEIVVNSGTADLFTWYDCFGKADGPCDQNDSLELVALTDTTNRRVHQPSQVVVQIRDQGRRAMGSEGDEGNFVWLGRTADAAGDLVWSTGFEQYCNVGIGANTCLPGYENRSGPLLRFNTTLLDLKTDTTETPPDVDRWGTPDTQYPAWERGYFKVDMSGPGKMETWDGGLSGTPLSPWRALEWGTSDAGYDSNPWIASGDETVGYTDHFYIEFSKLGTYQLTATIRTPYDDDVTDMTDGVEYSDTETYTFHVGPIVDLSVADGGASPDVATGQYAITISAENNGPDDARVDAEVTIDLTALPAGVTVAEHIVSDGTYSNGTWELGALKSPGVRGSTGKTGAATLTLILDGDDAASATTTATIANDGNYTVCIDYRSGAGTAGIIINKTLPHTNQADCEGDAATTNVWHTAVCVLDSDQTVNTEETHDTQTECQAQTDAHTWTENVCASSDGNVRANRDETECGGWFQGTVYDHKPANNTATITARAGTGGIGEGIPTLQAPAVHAPAVGIAWSEVEFLYGVPVKDYQVEWSIDGVSGWTQLETELTLPKLFDITIQSGQTRYYRVRAVNEAGVTGPWSAPMAAMPIDTSVPGITISETELTIREGESAQYTVALHARPHANVTVRINGGGVVSPSPGTLTFNTNDFNMPKTVELTGIQDNDPDNEQVNVTHTISSGDAGYRSLTPDPVAVTVLDDDSGVSVTADQASVNEGEDITFTLTRTGNTDSAITVDLSVSQRGSFLPANQLGARSVNIGANVDAETVTVETENDSVLESAGSVTLVVNSGTGYLLGTPRSATVNVQDDDGAPGKPGTLRAVEGDQQVTLLWDAAPVGDAPVLDYSYRMRRSDRSNWDPDWTTLSGGSTRRSHTVTGLTNGQEYIFQVRARNATGNGAEAEVRVNTRTIPGRPEVTVTARHQSLVVTWDVPDTGGRPTTEYRVQWKSGTESFDTTRQATTTTREHTIPNLTNGTEYRVRVQARTEAGWSVWSVERAGTPVARPATSLSITTNARDGVSEPFRVTFTFTDEDHDGNRFGVAGFDLDDIEVRYSPTVGYVFSMKDFREEVAGFRYSARLEDILEGTLSITVKEGAAQSTHSDGQQSTAASHSIRVEVPEAVAPTGTEIWASEITVGEYTGNARGYINRDLSVWNGTGKIGSLSDGDSATDDDEQFTYGGKDYTVGEVSFVPAWSSILFSVCPGIEGVNRFFDLYLDDQIADHADLTLNFDSDKVSTSKFDATIAGVSQTCAEYRWTPRRVDWEEDGTVNVRLVR